MVLIVEKMFVVFYLMFGCATPLIAKVAYCTHNM